MATAIEPDPGFALQVQRRSDVPLLRCYYCQKCTAGCPVAFAMDHRPAQVLRLIQMGQREAVLGSSAIWMCVGCEVCGTRCPNQIRLAPLFDTLRYMALEDGYKPEPVVHALHRSFLDSIKLWGRVHEMSMIPEYLIRSSFRSGITGFIGVGWYLLSKGKILHLPDRIRGVAQVRDLFKRSERDSAEEVQP